SHQIAGNALHSRGKKMAHPPASKDIQDDGQEELRSSEPKTKQRRGDTYCQVCTYAITHTYWWQFIDRDFYSLGLLESRKISLGWVNAGGRLIPVVVAGSRCCSWAQRCFSKFLIEVGRQQVVQITSVRLPNAVLPQQAAAPKFGSDLSRIESRGNAPDRQPAPSVFWNPFGPFQGLDPGKMVVCAYLLGGGWSVSERFLRRALPAWDGEI